MVELSDELKDIAQQYAIAQAAHSKSAPLLERRMISLAKQEAGPKMINQALTQIRLFTHIATHTPKH